MLGSPGLVFDKSRNRFSGDPVNIAKGFTFAISKCHFAASQHIYCEHSGDSLYSWVIKYECLVLGPLFKAADYK